MEINTLLEVSFAKRQNLIAQAIKNNTTCYRVFHGTVEGVNGLNIDRYGDLWLIQTFHQTLTENEITEISQYLKNHHDFAVIYNDRSGKNSRIGNELSAELNNQAISEQVIFENDIAFTSKLRHEGQDPLLFLDMRAGREFVQANSKNKTVLNLFAYTCGIGTAAAVGQAKKVINIDFSSFALAAGKKNAQLNDVSSNCEFIQSDVFAALRQYAGLKVSKRGNKKLPSYPKLSARLFDLIFLDPPRFAKSAFGTVDLVNDYQSLFKPAVLSTKKGGTIVCCNNVAKVDRETWFAALVRCVEKQDRKVISSTWLNVQEDFPSFDEQPPLKMVAICIE
ncbi:MAG: class I SAM-dependent methyltransferase [Saccharospirillaceae bacterium]|nr:class I SAM-dependent methyltransferase [Pseudomonadales bacterium]NRB80625.1 class I SAM-dependent methyltransferase [Saccharospirillaceae bacterium]